MKIFILGWITGLFLNKCIYKYIGDEDLSLFKNHRYYRERESNFYLIIPVINGLLFFLLYNNYSYPIDFMYYGFISSILLILLLIDLKKMIIPDNLILLIFSISVIYKLFRYTNSNRGLILLKGIGGLVLAGTLFLFIILISKGGMGDGDVTLISVLGFILGIKYILVNIFLSFILATIVALILLSLKIKTRKDPIPFGPFIVISFYIVLLYGEDILNWYLIKMI